MINKKRKTFDETFRQMIIGMHNGGMSVPELAKQFEIGESTIYNWTGKTKQQKAVETDVDYQQEYYKVKAQLSRLQTDFQILKRAALSLEKDRG